MTYVFDIDNTLCYTSDSDYENSTPREERIRTDWGVKHHGLFLGKAAGDIYVDDKGCKDQDFFTD
mgnify:CR=1 FL=1